MQHTKTSLASTHKRASLSPYHSLPPHHFYVCLGRYPVDTQSNAHFTPAPSSVRPTTGSFARLLVTELMSLATDSYTDGNDAYIFVPSEGLGPSLTIHRSSGEIFLNSMNTDVALQLPILMALTPRTQYSDAQHSSPIWKNNIRHPWDDIFISLFVFFP